MNYLQQEGGLLGTAQRKRALSLAALALICMWAIASWNSGIRDDSPASRPLQAHSKAYSGTTPTEKERQAWKELVQLNCSRVLTRQKTILFETFSQVFADLRNIALISQPDHENKGDSAIWVAEMELLASLGINIVYQAGVRDFNMTELDETVQNYQGDHFAIVFHGGGNFGDLYGNEHGLKLRVMRSYPEIRTHVFPQSLKFRSPESIQKTLSIIEPMRNFSIAVRDNYSLDFFNQHFKAHEGIRVDLTPDIVFYMGFRPELRNLLAPAEKDLIFFKRQDGEGTGWKWVGHTEGDFAQPLASALGDNLSFHAGDWAFGHNLNREQTSSAAGSTMNYRAWKRFMRGSEFLNQGEFGVLDRLHGHIFSLVLGIPHILIDNGIGKLGDYHSTWTAECPLGQLAARGQAPELERVVDLYQDWVKLGKISGRDLVPY